MKTWYCVYVGYYGCPKNELWGEYEDKNKAEWAKIAAESCGYCAEIRQEQFY